MKYKMLRMLFPTALAVSFLMSGNVLAAPESEQAVEVVEIPEEAAEDDESVEQLETESESGAEVILEEDDNQDTEEQILSIQQPVTPPKAESTFRFMKIEKNYALSKKKDISFYEEKDEESIVVGSVGRKGLIYILSEEEDGWVYAESGKVRGFVKSDGLLTGKSAERYVKSKGEEKLEVAEELIDAIDNEALTYKKITAYETVIRKRYAVALEDLEILDSIPEETEDDTENTEVQSETEETKEADAAFEDETEEPSAVGTLEEGGICYVLADASEEWIYVESGDVRGFVKAELLMRGRDAKIHVFEEGEENLEQAEEKISPEKNRACYYTLTSVKEASVSGLIRSAMIDFAEQFIGNPYVWGGTSLTNGADCSGFVQSIYSEFGYSLPRVAQDQAYAGIKIPVQDAAPGDLIFYMRNGEIYHVVMSLGDGRTIEAQSSATGIVHSTVNYNNAVWAVRIISDEDIEVLESLKAEGKADVYTQYTTSGYTYGKYLGNFKLTSYCACPVCCGVWSGGPTASGAMPAEGRTIAMGGVPFGTKLVIGGNVYTVEDRGTPYGHVDIYKNSHQDALNFGVQYSEVYLAE